MKNGTVTILGPDMGLKVIDVKVTNSFPMIALPRGSKLLLSGAVTEDIDGYQHLSIPKDLHVHLSPRPGTAQDHRFFTGIVDPTTGRLIRPFVRAVTYISPPVDRHRPFTGRWEGGAAVVSPFPDARYSPAVTRLFLDVLVHNEAVAPTLDQVRFAVSTMRPAPDRTDYRLGPYPFAGFQRQSPAADVYCTLRWGFMEAEPTDGAYVIPPDAEAGERQNAV